MAAEDGGEASSSSSITVRLQSKDRDSSQEFSLHRVCSSSSSSSSSSFSFVFVSGRQPVCVFVFQDAPLGSIFSQYLSRMSSSAQRAVRFHFDGVKVTHSQTPAQLDMEDGDIIEVWI